MRRPDGFGDGSGDADTATSGFPAVLRRYRVAARLTQEQLADRAGLSVRSVSQLERGRVRYPRPESVRLLGAALGLAAEDLVEFQELARSGYWADRGSRAVADLRTNIFRGLPRSPGSVVPAQLPADVVGFTGRRAELALLDAILGTTAENDASVDTSGSGFDGAASTAVVISAETGAAGVGTSALAIHWAHLVVDSFSDGQLYVDLASDGDEPVAAADALAGFLTALGVPTQELPVGVADRAARYRQEIAERRVLVVVDNASHAEQVRRFLPGRGASRVVIASRHPLPELDGAGVGRVRLGVLALEVGVALLERIVGDRVALDAEAAVAMAAECGGLPMTLRLAAGALSVDPSLGLAGVAAGFAAQRRRLGQPAVEDPTGPRAVLSWCYWLLPADAASAFRLLSAHPGSDLGLPAATALLGVKAGEAGQLLEALAAAGFVQPTAAGRFGVHSLLRAFAAEVATAEADSERRAALGRLFDYYSSAVAAALRALDPSADPYGTEPGGVAAALDWLHGEALALAAAVTAAAAQGQIGFLVGLVEALTGSLDADAVAQQPLAGVGPVERSRDGAVVRMLLEVIQRAAAGGQPRLLAEEAAHRLVYTRVRDENAQWRLLRSRIATVVEQPTRWGARGSTQMGPARDRPRWAGNPYRGLWPFTEDHAEVFFGRQQITAALLGKLVERLEGPALVLVTGASGAGKSSLLRAGVLPALAHGLLGVPGSSDWPRIVMNPAGRALEELAARLAPLAGLPVSTVARELADHPDQAHLLVRQVLANGQLALSPEADGASAENPDRLVLVVDQFEQIFAGDHDGNHGEASAFITAVLAAATTPCGPSRMPAALVVLGVRGDYWDRCAADPGLARILQDGQFVVGPMTESELRLAITGPAAAAGLEIEAGLVDTIMADLRSRTPVVGGDSGALPLLSQALHITYRHGEDQRLTVRGYGVSGGLTHAVVTSAEATYTALTPTQQTLAAHLFQQLTAIDPDGQSARRRIQQTSLQPNSHTPYSATDLQTVLTAFTDSRLLVVDQGSIDIAHDILLTAWPRLRQWLADDHAGRVIYSDLVHQASRWQTHGRDRSFLYRGTELTAARHLLTRWQHRPDRYPAPAPNTAVFLTASSRAQIRRRRSLAATVASILLVSSTLTGVAFQQRHSALKQREYATSQARLATVRSLLAQADALRTTDPRTALRLALAANQIEPDSNAFGSLYTTLNGTPIAATLTGHTDIIADLAVSPDGHTLATASWDHTAILWDITNPHRPARAATLTNGGEAVTNVAFSPDGRTLATTTENRPAVISGVTEGTTTLWDISNRRHPARIGAIPDSGVVTAVFSPDGHTLATASPKFTALWDVTNARRPIRAATFDPLQGVAFSPDGHTLATTDHNSQTAFYTLWDITSTHNAIPIATITGEAGAGGFAIFNPAGRTVAITSGARAIVWDIINPRRPTRTVTLARHTEPVARLAFSPDGGTLATVTGGTTDLWNATNGHHITALNGHTGGVTALAFNPDGRTLTTASTDRTAIIWELTNRHQPSRITTMTESTKALYKVVFSPNGRTLATAGEDHTTRLWDFADPHHPAQIGSLDGHTDAVYGLAFGPDGRTLATGSNDSTTVLWDISDSHHPRATATIPGKGPEQPTMRSDGRVVAIGTLDYTNVLTLWDITDRRHPRSAAHDPGPARPVTAVAFSPNGQILASTNLDNITTLWRVSDPYHVRPIARFTDHAGFAHEIAFSPDGHTLAAANDDHTATLWNVFNPYQPTRIATLTGHTDLVNSLAFSSDGLLIATASTDGTVGLWNITTPTQPARISTLRHTHDVYAVAFNPKGRTLVTTDAGQTIVWDISPTLDLLSNAIAISCTAAGGGLTLDQWALYIPGLPYERTC